MDKFEINILGCGSATPTMRHNPSSQVVNFRDNLFMIDCGEGTQKQMRAMHLVFSRLNHIFISHMHGDHCLGLPGLLSTMSLHERSGQLSVHVPAYGVDIVRRMVDFFCKDSTFDIKIEAIPRKGGRLFESDSLTVDAFELYHRVECYGFLFKEKEKMRHLRGDMAKFHQVPHYAINSIKQGADFVKPDGTIVANALLTTDADPARSYAYCSDTTFNEAVAEATKGVTLLYHEATYASDMAAQARQRGHSTAAEAGRIARLAGAGRLMIGHYSQRYDDVSVLVDDASTEFPSTIAANEGMVIKV